MANSTGVNCMRGITITINVIFVLTGILLIGLGSYALAQGVAELSSVTVIIGIIVLGCLVLIVSFFGCIGASRENRCMLMTYAIFILIFVLLEIAIGITAYVKREDIPSLADENWSRMYNEGHRDTIEDTEKLFKCCGWYNTTDRAVPPIDDTDLNTCVEVYDYSEPCSNKINETIEDSLMIAGITAIVIAVIQLICLLFACCLFAKLPTKKQKEEALLDEARRLNREGVSQNYQSYDQK